MAVNGGMESIRAEEFTMQELRSMDYRFGGHFKFWDKRGFIAEVEEGRTELMWTDDAHDVVMEIGDETVEARWP